MEKKDLTLKYDKYLTSGEEPLREFKTGFYTTLATNKGIVLIRRFPKAFIPVSYKNISNIEHHVFILWGMLFRSVLLFGISIYGHFYYDSFKGLFEAVFSWTEKNIPELTPIISAIPLDTLSSVLLVLLPVLGIMYLLKFIFSLSGRLKIAMKGAPSIRVGTPLTNDVRDLIKLVEMCMEGKIVSLMEKDVEALRSGHMYLVKEHKPEKSFRLFLIGLGSGCRGLYLSRTNPVQIKKEYGDDPDFQLFEDTIALYWLTDSLTNDLSVSPEPDQLFARIGDFIEKNPKSVILLDGLEYLISHANFEQVLCFVQGVKDKVGLADSRFIVPISPQALTEKEMALLEREMNKVL